MLQIIGKTNIDFMKQRNVAFVCSGLLVILGSIAFIQISRGAANLSIEFAGGAAVQLRFDKPIRVDEARNVLDAHGLPNAELQEFLGENKLLIRLKTSAIHEENLADHIVVAFRKEFPDNAVTVDSSTVIVPTIGQQLKRDALIAIIISIVGIILYITARFELRFGISAALAMLHDVLAVLGLFYVLDKEFTPLVMTAVLTLAGYSLTDKVVVFDRIRENLRSRRRETLETIINNSINQVLSRTVVTSLTVILVLIPLAVIGGEVLHDFALALLWGVVIGTYSSIFLASPFLLLSVNKEVHLLRRS